MGENLADGGINAIRPLVAGSWAFPPNTWHIGSLRKQILSGGKNVGGGNLTESWELCFSTTKIHPRGQQHLLCGPHPHQIPLGLPHTSFFYPPHPRPPPQAGGLHIS